ncbi:MAG: alpha/beta hydrolase [Dehalococcoidia bacterium]
MTPTSRHIEANGLSIHYVDWGGEGKQPMVLLHGLQDCARLWDYFALPMSAKYHVIAVDHRGHGDSPRATPESYKLTDYVSEVGDVIEGLGLTDVVLAGHSAGSKNAWIYAAGHPGRISRLIITDMDPDSHNPGSVEMISRYKSEDDDYADLAAVIERLRSRQPHSTDDVLEHCAVHLTKPNGSGGLVWKRDRTVVTAYDRPEAWGFLPQLSVPTLIVRGADSTLLTSPVARRMNDMIPDCRLVELPHAAHWVHLEQIEAYQRTVEEFLEG